MSDYDDKMPPLPGIEEDEISDAVEIENEVVDQGEADDDDDEITADTVFTEEELDLYDNEELEAICDLKGIEIPDDGVENSDLKLKALILGTYEVQSTSDEGEESDGTDSSDEENSERNVEVEEETEDKSDEPVDEGTEASEKDEEKSEDEENKSTTEEVDAEETGVVEEKKEKSKPKDKKSYSKKAKNPIKEKAESKKGKKEDDSEEEEEVKPVKTVSEKDLPDVEVPDVKVKQSAITVRDNVNEAGVLDYRPNASLDDLLAGAQKLIDGGLACGHITPEAVLGVVKYGSEIGMSAMTALNNIHMVSGKPTLGVHAIAAQLKKFGVAWDTVQNFEAEEDGDVVTTIKFTDLGMMELYKREITYASTELKGKAAELYLETVEEEIKPKISQVFSYRWSDAAAASLVGKSNWKNHPKTMLFNRCLTLGGRAFKPEALMGMMESIEYAEVEGVDDEESLIVLTD